MDLLQYLHKTPRFVADYPTEYLNQTHRYNVDYPPGVFAPNNIDPVSPSGVLAPNDLDSVPPLGVFAPNQIGAATTPSVFAINTIIQFQKHRPPIVSGPNNFDSAPPRFSVVFPNGQCRIPTTIGIHHIIPLES